MQCFSNINQFFRLDGGEQRLANGEYTRDKRASIARKFSSFGGTKQQTFSVWRFSVGWE
jgi:hypothetical protein